MWEQYSAAPEAAARGRRRAPGRWLSPRNPGTRALCRQEARTRLTDWPGGRSPPALWQELHAYYRLAEVLECAVTAVSDPAPPNAIGISCYSTYSHALLLGLADLCAMSVKQIELTDRWLAEVGAQGVPIRAAARDRGSGDPRRSRRRGGRRSSPTRRPVRRRRCASAIRASSRPAYAGASSDCRAGANPAELQLGHDCSVEQCTTLLGHLDSRWYRCRAGGRTLPPKPIELCAGGLPVASSARGPHLRPQGSRGPASFASSQHCRRWRAHRTTTRQGRSAEREWAWEAWRALQWREAHIGARGPRHRWVLEQLVIVRDGERDFARVRHARRSRDGSRRGRPHADAPAVVRRAAGDDAAAALGGELAEDPPLPALRLAETPEDKADASCCPPHVQSGPRVALARRRAGAAVRLTRLLQRGVDFERVAFEEIA